jgi:hypothetical protein
MIVYFEKSYLPERHKVTLRRYSQYLLEAVGQMALIAESGGTGYLR